MSIIQSIASQLECFLLNYHLLIV